jgi:hypothetical protein
MQQQYYSRDHAQCLAMAKASSPSQQIFQNYYGPSGGGLLGGFVNGLNIGQAISSDSAQNEIYSHCMAGLGWYEVSSANHGNQSYPHDDSSRLTDSQQTALDKFDKEMKKILTEKQ